MKCWIEWANCLLPDDNDNDVDDNDTLDLEGIGLVWFCGVNEMWLKIVPLSFFYLTSMLIQIIVLCSQYMYSCGNSDTNL